LTSVSCTFYIDPISTNKDILQINGIFSAATTESFEIQIDNFWNMPTTRPYDGFEIWTYDASSFGIDNKVGITVAMYTPARLDTSLVSVTV